MNRPRRILVAFDSSRASKRACDHAVELSAALGGTLVVLHVIQRFELPLTAAEGKAVAAAAARDLARADSLVRPYAPDLETRIVEGTPWQEIEKAAREGSFDMIVLGTHGRRGLSRALLGSVAEHVVKTSPIPVMTVPEYVALSRNDAGERLASALSKLRLEWPHVVALSRSALTVATALRRAVQGTVDFWAVEPVATADAGTIGAVGEDGRFSAERAPAPSFAPTMTARDEAIALALQRVSVEVSLLRGARPPEPCRGRDVVLVADGLFDDAEARVAVDAYRVAGARRIVVASPVISRATSEQLHADGIEAVTLERAMAATSCSYRDDVVPSDLVAEEILFEERNAATARAHG